MSDSFTFRSVDYGGTDYGVVVISNTFQRLPEPRVNVAEFSQADGGVTQGSSFRLRRFRLECWILATSDTARATRVGNVVAQLAKSQQVGPADLTIDAIPNRVFKNARLTSPVDGDLYYAGERVTLDFVCDTWPVAASATEETDIVIASGEGEAIVVGGNTPADTEWVLKNGGTPAAGLTFVNAATEETVIWPGTLPAGAWLKMDSATQRTYTSEDDGETWEEVTEFRGVVPRVSGGVTNTVTVTGASGTLDATYTEGYYN